MKKILAVLLTAFITCSALSAKENLFSFSAGLASGVPVYGANSVVATGSGISNGNRVILGSVFAVNFNVLTQVSFFLGNDILWDMKVYPGLGGLNLGLAYTLGFRADSIKIQDYGEYNKISSWGNGFKFQVEYNFAHEGKSRFYPSVGGYWNLMPRGNKSYDNLIVLYISANF